MRHKSRVPIDVSHSRGVSRITDERLNIFLAEANKYPPIPIEEERILFSERALLFEGDSRRKEIEAQIIKSHLLFVVAVAKIYMGKGVPIADLIQNGCVGLMTALERFNHTRGVKFISYAVWWIRQGVTSSFFTEKDGMAGIKSRTAQEKAMKMIGVVDSLTKQLSRSPKTTEVADVLGLEIQEVEKILQIGMGSLSTDYIQEDDDSDSPFINLISNDEANPEEDVQVLDVERGVQENLVHLSMTHPREAEVLRFFFGLGGEERQTLEEIGARFGLSRERIRQIKNKGLSYLRTGHDRLKQYFDELVS